MGAWRVFPGQALDMAHLLCLGVGGGWNRAVKPFDQEKGPLPGLPEEDVVRGGC